MAAFDLLNPVIAFIAYLGAGLLVYLLGAKLAPALRDTGSKLLPYACGEIAPVTRMRPDYNFYTFAFLFAILHVAAVVTCTAWGIVPFALPLLYVSLVFFGIAIVVAG